MRGEELLTAYLDRLGATGRGNVSYERAARRFLRRWPDPQAWAALSLQDRLAEDTATRPLITFLMLHHGLAPGYDYLLERKLSSVWREIHGSPLQGEIDLHGLRTDRRDFGVDLGPADQNRTLSIEQLPGQPAVGCRDMGQLARIGQTRMRLPDGLQIHGLRALDRVQKGLDLGVQRC